MPAFDQAFAALIRDLDQRRTARSTLVMVSSEFGRTPKINTTPAATTGRKVFSVVLAGGGIKRGLIYGTSDPTGGEPEQRSDRPRRPRHDASITSLGIDPDKGLMAPGNRPIEIVHGGKVVQELLA